LIRVKDKEYGYRYGETSIFLYPMSEFSVEKLEKLFFLNLKLKTTRKLGILSEGHILSAVRPGKRYIFDFFSVLILKSGYT
jgi:hypothetical protein